MQGFPGRGLKPGGPHRAVCREAYKLAVRKYKEATSVLEPRLRSKNMDGGDLVTPKDGRWMRTMPR